jgi:DNA-binding transcriptional ArsR family regulator
MSHGTRHNPAELAETGGAGEVAELMQALATPSRLRILGCLHRSPLAVGELSEMIGMEASAVSHQLRVLRDRGLVIGHRTGRIVIYRLHDEHVGRLLTEAMSHVEHLRLDVHAGRTPEELVAG